MKIVVLNEDSYDCNLEDFGIELVWLVYHYTSGDYEGFGEAVGLGEDGKLYFHNLGHCSCFGPFWDNDFPNGGSLSVEEFITQGEVVTDETLDEVRKAAYKLLGV